MWAKDNDLAISIDRYHPEQKDFRIEIEQPLGSGYGIAHFKVSRSHRSMDRLRILGANGFIPTTIKCTAYNFFVPNTFEMIEKCMSISGVSLAKRKPPQATFYVTDGEVREREY